MSAVHLPTEEADLTQNLFLYVHNYAGDIKISRFFFICHIHDYIGSI